MREKALGGQKLSCLGAKESPRHSYESSGKHQLVTVTHNTNYASKGDISVTPRVEVVEYVK